MPSDDPRVEREISRIGYKPITEEVGFDDLALINAGSFFANELSDEIRARTLRKSRVVSRAFLRMNGRDPDRVRPFPVGEVLRP